MSEEQCGVRGRGGYLHVVRKPGDPAQEVEPQELTPAVAVMGVGSSEGPSEGPSEAAARHDAGSVIGTAVMHAAMSWVACCMELHGVRVDVSQIAPGLFDATVYLSDEAGAVAGDIMLRVKLDLTSGPVLRSQVEPVHP